MPIKKKLDFENKPLYHITAINNLNSILQHGLLPLKLLNEKKIFSTYITSEKSRDKDVKSQRDKYVRLAYTPQYDMIAVAVNFSKMIPAIIEIKTSVLIDYPVEFSTMNAITTNSKLYKTQEDVFPHLDFEKIYSTRSTTTIQQEYKNARQSELLVDGSIDLGYIEKIRVPFGIKNTLINPNNINIIEEDTKECFKFIF